MSITIIVPALPIAQPRPRATLAAGGLGARIHEVTSIKNPHTGERKPHPIAAFKATVRMAAQQVITFAPLTGALRVDLVFVFPRPKARIWARKPMPRYPHTGKPDRDNLMKSVQDALTGLAWVDDAQICAGETTKWVAAGDEQPRVEIVIERVSMGEQSEA